MPNSQRTPGIVKNRLPRAVLDQNFADIQPPFGPHEAQVASDRCYFCHDAPCVTACPTSIDVPLFIRQIGTGAVSAAGHTILDRNILGGMCARVCPTETLCEQACVRGNAGEMPVEIGRLQRHATDHVMAQDGHPFERAAPTGCHVAVVGAGPAGLACAHRLAMKGHEVTMFDRNPSAGGLNEYGLAVYKTFGGFAQAEIEWLLRIGGITVKHGVELGLDVTLSDLTRDHDAVFLGIGLGTPHILAGDGHEDFLAAAEPAVDFIRMLRMAEDYAAVPIGRSVVVIGGGMTAIDAAIQSKLLGAETVTIAYRRAIDDMPASRHERNLAAARGVQFIGHVQPIDFSGMLHPDSILLEYTRQEGDQLLGTGESFRIPADQVFLAIGQGLGDPPDEMDLDRGKIAVSGGGRSSIPGVWAGGDCAAGGEDLTVTAVAQGRDAAEDIHAELRSKRR